MKVKIKSTPQANNGIQLLGEGQIKPLSMNMFSSPMMEFKGNSHDQGGIPIQYGNNKVEVEGDETAFVDNQGSLAVLGNLKVPGTNQKFKNAGKEIANAEKRAQRLQTKGTNLVEESNPYDQYSALSFNSGRALMDAAVQKQLNLSFQKEQLASIQNAMLGMAESSGKSPQDISRIMKDGGKVEDDPYAQLKKVLGAAESSNNYFVGNDSSSAFGKYQFIKGTRKGYYNKAFKDKYATFEEFDQAFRKDPQLQEAVMDTHLRTLGEQFNNDPQSIILAHRLGPDAARQINERGFYMNKGRKVTLDTPIGSSSRPTDRETPRDYLRKTGINPTVEPIPESFKVPKQEVSQMSPYMGESISTYNPQPVANIPQPTFQETGFNPNAQRPMTSLADSNRLGITNFLPEIAAMFDRPDFVQGQTYNPNLLQPYQVSFQDRLNENQASFRAIQQQLPNNPAALSVLAGQKYSADAAVLGEQFRTNQGIQNQVINQNTQILNDAELRNLQLRDQQYMRQEQARANTNTRRNQAVASISDKFNKNRAENMNIRLVEQTSGYRYNPLTKQMEYQGPDAAFNFYGAGTTNSDKIVTTRDANGNIINIKQTDLPWYEEQIKQERLRKAQSANNVTVSKWGGKYK